MLPARRLAVLLDTVKRMQIENCLYHTSNEPPSLYTDHSCDRSQFPSEVVRELPPPGVETSQDEVWQVRFSPNGRLLATCGSDNQIYIWDPDNFSYVTKLTQPEAEIGNLAWSPDSKLILSCGLNHFARVFDVDVSALSEPPNRVATTNPRY